MRAAWWVLKLVWRAATRVRRYFGADDEIGTHPTEWVMGGPLEPEHEAPAAAAPELEHPAVEREARELTGKLARGRGGR